MRSFALGMVAVVTLLAVPATSFAQGISVGPGGVRIDDGRDRNRGRGEYYEERRAGPPRGMCRELRRACMNREELGEQGAGNCRRYRRMCT